MVVSVAAAPATEVINQRQRPLGSVTARLKFDCKDTTSGYRREGAITDYPVGAGPNMPGDWSPTPMSQTAVRAPGLRRGGWPLYG